MYTLHIANKNYSSWSLRPWVLMKTLGIPFEEKLHPFPDDRPSYPDFIKFSPTGLVPVLDDGDIVVWESLGITEYLGDRYAAVWPAGEAARAWARSAVAEMHAGFSTLRNVCGMNCGIRVELAEYPEARRGASRAAMGRRTIALRRAVPRGGRIHSGRCILLPRGLPGADLRPRAERHSAGLR